MAIRKQDSYALLTYEEGWKAINRPAPYDQWNTPPFGPEYCSSYNTSATQQSSRLNAFCVKALLAVADRKNSEIGICKITTGSYASQWALPDGSMILAHAQENGALYAAIREPSGRFKNIPGLGNKDTAFDPSSILALYILIEADRASQSTGNTQTITWELIERCRKNFEAGAVMDEKDVYMVNDTLYYGLTYQNGIPCSLKNGNISLLKSRRIEANEFASAEIICGNPDLLVPSTGSSGSAPMGRMDIATAKKEFQSYSDTMFEICCYDWQTDYYRRVLPENVLFYTVPMFF